MTEYVHAEQTGTTPANAAVTDIRLQVDGAANQHVDVRLVQQADGLHVSVRSNDPVIHTIAAGARSGADHTARSASLSDRVFLPGDSAARHMTPTNGHLNRFFRPQPELSGTRQSAEQTTSAKAADRR